MTMTAFGVRHARAGESSTEVVRIDGETGEARRLTATTLGTPTPVAGE